MLKTLLSISLLLLSAAPGLWAENPPKHQFKKYLSPDQIEIHHSSILVHLNNAIVEVDALQADQGGLFANEESMRCYSCRRTIDPRNTCENPSCPGKK